MIGQEHHRHIAVKCFAQFMTRTQVVKVFMEEFQDELPKPTHRIVCRDEVHSSEYYRTNNLIFIQFVPYETQTGSGHYRQCPIN